MYMAMLKLKIHLWPLFGGKWCNQLQTCFEVQYLWEWRCVRIEQNSNMIQSFYDIIRHFRIFDFHRMNSVNFRLAPGALRSWWWWALIWINDFFFISVPSFVSICSCYTEYFVGNTAVKMFLQRVTTNNERITNG